MTPRTGRTPLLAAALLAATLVALPAAASRATQPQGYDDALVALAYHKVTGEPLDLAAIAGRSDAVRRATSFDRADVARRETARLQSLLDAAGQTQEFTLRVSDQITDYDHDRGEFAVQLFTPGYFLPVEAFGQRYQLVFANAEGARAIPMPTERARELDAAIRAHGRAVTNELRFRVVGSGDPAGAVTGARVIRAELLAQRLLDRDERVVWTPTVTPIAAAASGAAAADPAALDLAGADVAGFRVGVAADDLEATLQRLVGPTRRGAAPRDGHPGIAATLAANEMGCMNVPGRRTSTAPGAVCVTALLDRDDVVRTIRVERVFPWMDAETFRRTLVRRYGPVADARGGSGLALGWGPPVHASLLYSSAGPQTALTAHFGGVADFTSRGANRLGETRVVLNLVDARWAAGARP